MKYEVKVEGLTWNDSIINIGALLKVLHKADVISWEDNVSLFMTAFTTGSWWVE